MMKDAYSFDRDEEAFAATYQLMMDSYSRIFDRLGLKTDITHRIQLFPQPTNMTCWWTTYPKF